MAEKTDKIVRYSEKGAKEVIAHFTAQAAPIAKFEKEISDCSKCSNMICRLVYRNKMFEPDYDCTSFTDPFGVTLRNNVYPIVIECKGFAKKHQGEVVTKDSFDLEEF
jgi:hypothetical protein